MEFLVTMALLISGILCYVAYVIASSSPQKVADQYRLASCGSDSTVVWSKSSTPAIVKDAQRLQASIIETWPLAVKIAPSLQSIQGPRQMRFAIHEAMLADMYGLDQKHRFKEVYLGMSWIEWNAMLHAKLCDTPGDATEIADEVAEHVWNYAKDNIPTIESPHDTLKKLASARFNKDESSE